MALLRECGVVRQLCAKASPSTNNRLLPLAGCEDFGPVVVPEQVPLLGIVGGVAAGHEAGQAPGPSRGSPVDRPRPATDKAAPRCRPGRNPQARPRMVKSQAQPW